MKELMIAVSGLFGTRCTNKQKERFICYMREWARENNLKCVLDTGKIGHHPCRNIYLGNFKRAKTILTIPYDTATRMMWPGNLYYPVNARKSMIQNSISKGLDLLFAITLIVAYYLFVFRYSSAEGTAGVLRIIGMLLVTLLGAKTIHGWANRNNYARNSASIVVALECIKRLGQDSIVVALLDHSCCGFGGYHQLSDYLDRKGMKKKIIALDCVASGQELHLHSRQSAVVVEEVQSHLINDEDRKQSIMELFPECRILTGGSRIDGETVISNTRSGRDCQIDLDKMERTVDIIYKLTGE